jgi:hypothetical protein
VAHCQPCRREAIAAGLDSAILTHVPLPKRAAAKIAALLPFPIFGSRRGEDEATLASGGSGPGWTSQLPMLSEQLSGGWGKLATAAAVLVAGVGAAGVGSTVVGAGDGPADRAVRPAAEQSTTGNGTDEGVAVKQSARGTAPGSGAERRANKGSRRSGRAGSRAGRRDASDGSGGAATLPAGTGGGGGGGANGAKSGGGGAGLPGLSVPASGENPIPSVQEAVEDVVEPVQPAVDDVVDTVESVTEPVQDSVGDATDAVEGATGGDLPLP